MPNTTSFVRAAPTIPGPGNDFPGKLSTTIMIVSGDA